MTRCSWQCLVASALLYLLVLLVDKSSSIPPRFHGYLLCDVCFNMPVCSSFSLLHFSSPILGPYSFLFAVIFVLLPILFLLFQSWICGVFSYVILQISFQILVQFKLAKTTYILPIPNNLCSRLLLSQNIISMIITEPVHQAQSVAAKAMQ